MRAALSTGFSFMLRCSEYLSRGAAGFHTTKVLRGVDVQLRRDGVTLAPEDYASANEVSVYLRESKADQFNRGALIVHHAVEDPEHFDLCPVRAVRNLFALFHERAREESHMPLFRWESGEAVTRYEVRGILGRAGEVLGVPWDATGTHSLRIGGTSALYHWSGGNGPLVKRLGRWASEAFEGYVWETEGLTRGVAWGMLGAP